LQVPKQLTQTQIELACRELLASRRRVGVRDVMHELQRRHGVSGRTQRVGAVLKDLQSAPIGPVEASTMSLQSETRELQEQLKLAQQRALRAEELERRHQDYWAARYDERAQELELKYAESARSMSRVTSEQYLRLYQRAVELARRLARYETVDPVTK